jgi:hypothetical protein
MYELYNPLYSITYIAPYMAKPVKENIEKPPCEWCGCRTVSRGFEIFATDPHKRRKFTCTSEHCGHTFVPKIKYVEEKSGVEEQDVVEQSD